MSNRPVTLFTGQWADLPLERLAEMVADWGFDGLELACWGDHFEVDKALSDDGYLRQKRQLLEEHGLECWAISNHLVGQATCDPIDERHRDILPEHVWGDGDPAGVRERAAEEMKRTAEAARRFEVDVVNGFTGSGVWNKLYFFPPTTQGQIQQGYDDFGARWKDILEAFREREVMFGLEVHPTEIAYDLVTTERALEAVDHHPNFGFNFDPSHFIHQFIDPVEFLKSFSDRIVHVHIKDSKTMLDGRASILSSHLSFGDPRRGWDFVSPGRGDVDFDEVVRALNRLGYDGPLSIEWEDSGMDREFGAQEALEFIRGIDFAPSDRAFDAAFGGE